MSDAARLAAGLVQLEEWAYEYVDALKVGEHGFVFHDGEPPWWEYPHGKPLRVLVSGRTEADGRRWIHVSVSNQGRLPSWEALKKVKAAFIGDDKQALQVFPPASQWYTHYEVLHLWHCIDGDGIPDFRVPLPGQEGKGI